ncbi:signal transduction histidine kinase [Motilibacter peucedani]|uniref:histidine kinase n=2 Tax=Motilibacter peucedani TaxID=598650 RepID=A0A420XTL1_9ACTN|nr:signal transduction histidine kinase [Motilibacter peucedani]
MCLVVLGDIGHLMLMGGGGALWGRWQTLAYPLALLLTVWLLRRMPLVTLGVLLLDTLSVAFVFTSTVAPLALFVLVDLALAYVAATCRRSASAVAAGASLFVLTAATSSLTTASSPVEGVTLRHVSPVLSLTVVLAVGLAWLVGNTVRERRLHARTVRDQATLQAVTAERLRIARELHDVVAHSIGVIAIQAGMGSRVFDTQPEEARQALSAIERTSRETLTGLRTTLGTLRRTDDREEPVPRAPAPGLADLDRLVATTADAGVAVELTWDGPPRALPAELDLSAFRIVQEALTNVVRHAGTSCCQVRVVTRPDEVVLEVVDHGRGLTGTGEGYGLVGMRERVELLRGKLEAGPGAEGGFRVLARLPVGA